MGLIATPSTSLVSVMSIRVHSQDPLLEPSNRVIALLMKNSVDDKIQ